MRKMLKSVIWIYLICQSAKETSAKESYIFVKTLSVSLSAEKNGLSHLIKNT